MNRYHKQGEQMWRNPQNWSWASQAESGPRGCRNGIPASHRISPTRSDECAWKGIQTGLCSCWCPCLIPLPVFVPWSLFLFIPVSREEQLTWDNFNPNSGLIEPPPPIQRKLLLMLSYVWKHVWDNFYGNFSFWNIQGWARAWESPEHPKELLFGGSVCPGDTKGDRDTLDAPKPKVVQCVRGSLCLLPFLAGNEEEGHKSFQSLAEVFTVAKIK